MIALLEAIDALRFFFPEAEGWHLMRRPCPDLGGADPLSLLAQTAWLPGHFRYATVGDGAIVLLGEVRDPDVEGLDFLASEPAHVFAELRAEDEETVEAALEQAGLPWKRREAGWAIPASDKMPREIRILPENGGVRVSAVLVEWDEIGVDERQALARFFCRAQANLRFARCELDATQARVVARVPVAELEAVLPHAVGGVAAGVRVMARETSALLAAPVARAYLDFLHRDGARPASS